jgi:tannase
MQCVWFNDEARFLNVQDTALLSDFDNITYDDLRDWITLGLQQYSDALQTNWPDLSSFQSAGGKIFHLHGERFWNSLGLVGL